MEHRTLQFSYHHALLDTKTIRLHARQLTPYIAFLNDCAHKNSYDTPESSINLPFDHLFNKKIASLIASKITAHLKYVILVGIGGSNLGTQAIIKALPPEKPRIIFLDTLSPRLISEAENILLTVTHPKEFVIFLISKSGTTIESVVNFEFLYRALTARFSTIIDRVVTITDENSKLWHESQEKNITTLAIPKNIGGRYSVFSAVGIAPLLAAGINTDHILTGARDMRTLCLTDDPQKNPALASAILLYLHAQQGKTINNNFLFNPELENLGKWYRQLMAESIGKSTTVGITPMVSIGTTDLHSMEQLYAAGPHDKFTTFIYGHEQYKNDPLPSTPFLALTPSSLHKKTITEIRTAIFRGVTAAYQKRAHPFTEINLGEINEYSLGQFMQFKMMEIMLLAKLMQVNAFDQPAVEDYKKEIQQYLLK